MKKLLLLISLLFVLCSCSNELNIVYGSYTDTTGSVEDILSGKAQPSSNDYVLKISNLSETAYIRCASGKRITDVSFSNQAIAFADSRDGTRRGFPNRPLTRSYLPYCKSIKSENDFEIALEKLKKMAKAFNVCGDINVKGTQEQADAWAKCQEDIVYGKQ